MARTDKYSIQKGTLDDIADAIREKRGHSNSMSPGAMPNEIRAIEGGSPITVGFDKGYTSPNDVWYYENTDPDSHDEPLSYMNRAIYQNDNWFNYQSGQARDYIFDESFNSGVMLFYQTHVNYTAETPWIGVRVETSGDWRIQRHTFASGFGNDLVPDANNNYDYTGPATFRKTLTQTTGSDTRPEVWIITGENITFFGFATSTTSSSTSKPNNEQPCVYKAGDLPYLESMHSDPGSTDPTKYCWSTKQLVCESMSVGYYASTNDDYITSSGVKDVKNAWKDAHSLIGLSTYIGVTPPPDAHDTDEYTYPLDCSHLFENCYNLRTVSLSEMFAGWANNNMSAPVSDMSYMFKNCYLLKSIGFDDANILGSSEAFASCYSADSGYEDLIGGPVSFSHFCENCYSLEELRGYSGSYACAIIGSDFSYAFNNCYSLRKPATALIGGEGQQDFITSTSHMFANCYSITEFDMKFTSGSCTALEHMDYMFYNCRSLTKLSYIDSSIADYTSMPLTVHNSLSDFDHMFDGCTSLTIAAIPFSLARDEGGLVSMSGMFANCHALETVVLTEWSFLRENYGRDNDLNLADNNKVRDISYMFYNCWSLKYTIDHTAGLSMYNYKTSFNINYGSPYRYSWDVCVWDHAFENCYSIEKMDLYDWCDSIQSVYPNASCSYTVSFTDAFKSLKKLRTLNLPQEMNVTVGQTGLSLQDCPGLCNYAGYTHAVLSHGYYDCDNLTRASLVSCISGLDTVNSTQTLTIGSVNLAKLSAADIAVATQKGWTVA